MHFANRNQSEAKPVSRPCLAFASRFAWWIGAGSALASALLLVLGGRFSRGARPQAASAGRASPSSQIAKADDNSQPPAATKNGTNQAVLSAERMLAGYGWLENRDYDWYQRNIPLLETPDAELNATYYYRWELVTRHLTYGSPNSGYSYTEFIDRPFWSGRYGSISCPAGHQLYEVRWLHAPEYSRDYYRYWLKTEGAQPRRYSTWLADAAWAVEQVQGEPQRLVELLPELVQNYEGWEREHFDAAAGMFWQTGHDDGMEFNINSRQTKDKLRGAPAYRPTLNAYLWADALAIARVARLRQDDAGRKIAEAYTAKAAGLKERLQKSMWDPRREFFFPQYQHDETDGEFTIKARTLTYDTGRFAGSAHGRELIGYVPWQFNLPDPGYEAAWKFLMDSDYFFAERGPTTTERHDPLFQLADYCCVWSGQSWPYATTQTLVAMTNLLDHYEQKHVTKEDYYKLLRNFALTHRKEGRPYVAEGCHPDTGSWKNYDSYNHSEHYFHSGFCDLVITGLVGLHPRDDATLEVQPLAPDEWDYFALDNVWYRGRKLQILWDRTGTRYGRGQGLLVFAGGQKIASAATLSRLVVEKGLESVAAEFPNPSETTLVNFAVNNEGRYYPSILVSYSNPKTPPADLVDGNYRYDRAPPNRWTCEGSPNREDWCEIDFGAARPLSRIVLHFLDDGEEVRPPEEYRVELFAGSRWQPLEEGERSPSKPAGRRANVVSFSPREASKVRVTFRHAAGGKTGLSELEAWGPARLPVAPAPGPVGNLALNATGKGFPNASASHTSRYDAVERANDGVISFRETPNNRWTSYESKAASDWLAVDFGEKKQFSRVVLYLYDDRGGVQVPASYSLESWDGSQWKEIPEQKQSPAAPAPNQQNTVTFPALTAQKLRVVFTHRGAARSGLSEIEVWKE